MVNEAVPRRERQQVKVKKTMDRDIFLIVGPGGVGIQRRQRKVMPQWALQKLEGAATIEALAYWDRLGRWCLETPI